MARSQLRFGVEPATVRRAAENLRDQAQAESLEIVQRSKRAMEEAIEEVSSYYGLDPDLYDGGIEVTVEDSPDGPRFYTELSPGASEGKEIAIAVREWGRRSYMIRPVTAKKLKFEIPGESKPVFSAQARIPESPAYNILRRARDRVYQRMRRGTV